MWPRESSAILQDLLSKHRCAEISMQYTCSHCQELQVTLPPVLQRKDGRLNGRAAMQILKAQFKRCERIRMAGSPTGVDDESALQFRLEIPLARCEECLRLGRPEEQCGERDSLRCGGVVLDLPSVKEKQEDPLPVAVHARQLLQWLQLAPQAKPQRILLTSARPEPPGGDFACNVMERVRKVTGWSPFAIALLAWTLGCVAYAFHHAPESPGVNPDLLYEQFQRRIEDIPMPESSPQYQQYQQYYLRQYKQHLEEYAVLHAQWQQNRPLFNWQALLHGMGVGVLVFAAALAFCEYYYGTISCWMELAEELWYVWQERWSKSSDPLGDAQKMERFLREMGEEGKLATSAGPPSPAAPSASAKTPAKEERRKADAVEAKGQRSSTKAEPAPEESKRPEPPPRPVPTPSRASAPPPPEARSAPTQQAAEAAPPEPAQVPPQQVPPQQAAPEQAPPPQVPPQQARPQQLPPHEVPPQQPAPKPVVPPRQPAAAPKPDVSTESLREPSPESIDEWVAAQRLAATSPAGMWPPSDAREAALRQTCRATPDGLGSNVRERLRRKVIERHREQIRSVVAAEPSCVPFKVPPVAPEVPRRREKANSGKELLREAEELLCQLEAENLLKQLAEEEERKRATAEKKALRAKLKAADRATKSAESGHEGDSSERKQDIRGMGDADTPNDMKHSETTAGSEESGRDDSTELEEVPSVEPEESLSAEAEAEEEAEEVFSADPDEVTPQVHLEEVERIEEASASPLQQGELPVAEFPREVEEQLGSSLASNSCTLGDGLEVVVGRSRRRQRHRAAAALAVGRSRTDVANKPEHAAHSSSSHAAARQPAKPEPSWNSPTAMRVKNTFIEFPEDTPRVNGQLRTRSAPCCASGRERQEAVVEELEASAEKPTPPASGPRSRKKPEDRAKAMKAEERPGQQEAGPRDVRRRPEPARLGVWDDLPPRAGRAKAQDDAAKERPPQKPAAERKERPSVWDDLPTRTQSGPLPKTKQPSAWGRREPPLGLPLSPSDGAAAGASILQALRNEQDVLNLPAAETTPNAEAGSQTSAGSRALRAEAPEFVPAPPLLLPAEPQLVPAMFVVGPNQQMLPLQVMPLPLPEGEQLLGFVPMHDQLAQEQGEQAQCPSSLVLPPEPAATGPFLSGDATPSPRETSEDVLAKQMEMLRSMLQQQQMQDEQPAVADEQ